jgi:DNA recombination protein RmuC
VLAKTKKKLNEAANVIEDAEKKSKNIERKLRTVQELPPEEASALLGEAIEVEQNNEQADNNED